MQQQQASNVDLDEHNNPLMTNKNIQYYTLQDGMHIDSYLHHKLILKSKGFVKIIGQNISKYSRISILQLNNNKISKIQGLEMLINLTSLVLNNNRISKMQGLDSLRSLTILDLSENKIDIVKGISNLDKLQSLNLANNLLSNKNSIQQLSTAKNLVNLNLSGNQLQNTEQIFQSIIENRQLNCLFLKSTPFSRGFRNYRKKIIAHLKRLKFLDDRPIMFQEHRTAQAWLQGGNEAQKLTKEKIFNEKQARDNFERNKKKQHEKIVFSVEQINLEAKQEEKQKQTNSLNRHLQEQRLINQKDAHQRYSKKPIIIKPNQNFIYEKIQDSMDKSSITQISHKQLFTINKTLENQHQKDSYHCLINNKWRPKYQKLLEKLLLKYKFDFSQVQPSFNMILADINKKLMKGVVRFEIDELRVIWTDIQVKKRQMIISVR